MSPSSNSNEQHFKIANMCMVQLVLSLFHIQNVNSIASIIVVQFQILIHTNYTITLLIGPDQKWKEYDYRFDVVAGNVTRFMRFPINASFDEYGGSLIISPSVHKRHRFIKVVMQVIGKLTDYIFVRCHVHVCVEKEIPVYCVCLFDCHL